MREKDRRTTLFIDVDGTVLEHAGDATGCCTRDLKALPGVVQSFNDWSGSGACIVITTARKESMRAQTEEQLRKAGLFWDFLLMGVGSGRRIVINDVKNIDGKVYNTAIGVNLKRNEGFENIDKIYSETLNFLGEEGEHTIL